MLPIKRLKQNQEMNMALATNNARDSPILGLDVDCLDELFDYLSMEDLCAIGRTCKRLHRAAGKYFAKYYPFEMLSFIQNHNGEIIQRVRSCETYFANYVRCILISDDINIFRYAATKTYRHLKKITFRGNNVFSEDHYSCLAEMNILAQVSTIEIEFCTTSFRDSLLNRILQLCTNLKNLILVFSLPYEATANSNWKYQHCPTLERLEMKTCADPDLFEIFLRTNPHIKRLSMKYENIDSIFNTIQTSDMALDELELVVCNSEANRKICDKMIALNENGHVGKLKVTHRCNRQQLTNRPISFTFENIGCLVSLEVDCLNLSRCRYHDVTKLALLVDLKKLHFSFTCISLDDAEILSKALINLEELRLGRNSLFVAMPFARRLPKLRIVRVEKITGLNFDLRALNNDRKQLPDAEVLKIYLKDDAYRQLRWTSIDLFLDLVEVRRFNSMDD